MNRSIARVTLIIMFCSGFTLSCGGVTNNIRKNSELVGTVLSSKKALYYMEGCKIKESCGSTRVERHADRALVCEALNPSVVSLYERPCQIEGKTSFIVKSVVDIGCWGLQCTFSGRNYAMILQEDENGLLSTRRLSSMDIPRRDVCELHPITLLKESCTVL